jgi:hypothetical protein
MTTHTIDTGTRAGWPMYAALGAGVSVVLTALGTFWDFNGNDTGQNDGIGSYLIVVGLILVAVAVVFAVVARGASATKALVLGILSLLTIPVFWAGLPVVLAAGSAACAFGLPTLGAKAKVGVGLSAVATVLATVLAFVG